MAIQMKPFLLLLILLTALMSVATSVYASDAPHVTDATDGQRALYLEARDALDRNDTAAFEQLRQHLLDYPLLPYLDYAYLSPRLSELPNGEVDRFLADHADSYIADRLEREWVNALAEAGSRDAVVQYHNPRNTTTVLSCHALRARLETGDLSALTEVAALWNVSVSQPNECDPVFEWWMEAGLLTPEIAWERFEKTLQAGNRRLARYISGLMLPEERELAQLYLLIDSEPERLRNHDALAERNERMRSIVLHGVRRLAAIDAPQAMLMLHVHNDRHGFDEDTLLAEQRFIAMRLLVQGFVSETESLLRNTPGLATETLVSWLLRDAMRDQDWQRIETWLDSLSPDARESERWSYWRARTLARQSSPEAREAAEILYRRVAGTRSFYGFLAADLLGLEYELAERPVPVNGRQVRALYDNPSIVRAYELLQVADETNALNEWHYASRGMSEDEIISSGRLADSWGWHRNSIQAMIRAGYWDDLQLRFPLAYIEDFVAAASDYSLQPQFLFAVARQESAFMHDVRSPAGARGLMQLMPATARQTASRNGIGTSNLDLYDPYTNIRLGTHYMAELMEEFEGNRVLAAAAYNAGPNRVKQWLRRTADNPLPVDMWIETIPFAETRGYVQNVLAYSVIYGYRKGEKIRFLTEAEAGGRL